MTRYSVKAIALGAQLSDPEEHAAAVARIRRAFESSGGVVTHAAADLQIGLKTLQKWIGKYPTLEEALREVRDRHDVPHYVGDPQRAKK